MNFLMIIINFILYLESIHTFWKMKIHQLKISFSFIMTIIFLYDN